MKTSSAFRPRPFRAYGALALGLLCFPACAASGRHSVSMPPLFAEAPEESAPAPLEENYFKRDKVGVLSETELAHILAAPVFLAENARIGLVPVSERYDVQSQLPLEGVMAELSRQLGDSGQFEAVTEISTDWPAQGNIGGLRELAARYRTDYLLLYRHRFVDRSYQNAWTLLYATVVGAFLVPGHTVESSGLMEATLFDVRTGTILFTAFERVYGAEEENVWHGDRKRRRRQAELLEAASSKLARQVVDKVSVLVAARPAVSSSVASRELPPPAVVVD